MAASRRMPSARAPCTVRSLRAPLTAIDANVYPWFAAKVRAGYSAESFCQSANE